jgi:hypothetical protein
MGDNAVLTDLITCQGDVSRKKYKLGDNGTKPSILFGYFREAFQSKN